MKWNKPGIRILSALIALFVFAEGARCEEPGIIPLPQKMIFTSGRFTVTHNLKIAADDPAGDDAVSSLQLHLPGLKLTQAADDANPITGTLLITARQSDPALGDEGYVLDVTPTAIVIRAPHAAGMFYGAQTLLQLLPPQVFATPPAVGDWSVPCVHIEDKPRFRWRGLMLDVARHIEPREMILCTLDQMAMHKLNVFHWHLTDDQGWRIEIKKYPKLTAIGAWRNHAGFGLDPKLSDTYDKAGQYGGFYTQEEIRQVVAYAAHRRIVIVPEIEMPGHSTAAMAAYPELASSAGPFKTDVSAGVFGGIYDPANPKTFDFLQDVLSEVMDLFPSPYIHVGGDEVPKEPWMNNAGDRALMEREHLQTPEQLQSFFMARIGKFITAHGRHMIGWDEILEGGLAPDAIVMSWRGTAGGLAAAQANHDVVMTPTSHCYIDSGQGTITEPLERGELSLQKSYSYEPVPDGLDAAHAVHILGVQGNLWTEYVPNMAWAQYMTWPREAALAEVGWTDSVHRNFDDFAGRMVVDEKRLDAMTVNYRPVEDDLMGSTIHLSGDGRQLSIENPFVDSMVRYTLDGSFPSETSAAYSGAIELPKGFVQVVARYFRKAGVATPVFSADFLDGFAVNVSSTIGTGWVHRSRFFFASRWGMPKGSSLTIRFEEKPQKMTRILVQSGDSDKPGSIWQHGVLEISSDGKSFDRSVRFDSAGQAAIDCTAKPVASIRMTLSESQKVNPIIRTISLR